MIASRRIRQRSIVLWRSRNSREDARSRNHLISRSSRCDIEDKGLAAITELRRRCSHWRFCGCVRCPDRTARRCLPAGFGMIARAVRYLRSKLMKKDKYPSIVPCSRSLQFQIGKDSRGNWVVQDDQGVCGGLFTDRTQALRFAMLENGNRPQAVGRSSKYREVVVVF